MRPIPLNKVSAALLLFAAFALPLFAAPASAQGRADGLLRAELKPPSIVMLSASAAGRLVTVAVKDGDEVKAGELLIRIDDRMAELRLKAAKAARDQAATQLSLMEKLFKLKSRGELDVAMARAQFEGAEAEVEMAAELVRQCRITAPWDGWVTQLDVKENQFVPEGLPLLELAEKGRLEVEFMMPSSWLTTFKPGAAFEVQIDETGRGYRAELVRLGGKVDALTQSIRAYGRLSEDAEGLLPGMSGTVAPPEGLEVDE